MKEYVMYFKTKRWNETVVTTRFCESLEEAKEKAEKIKNICDYKEVYRLFEARTDLKL